MTFKLIFALFCYKYFFFINKVLELKANRVGIWCWVYLFGKKEQKFFRRKNWNFLLQILFLLLCVWIIKIQTMAGIKIFLAFPFRKFLPSASFWFSLLQFIIFWQCKHYFLHLYFLIHHNIKEKCRHRDKQQHRKKGIIKEWIIT